MLNEIIELFFLLLVSFEQEITPDKNEQTKLVKSSIRSTLIPQHRQCILNSNFPGNEKSFERRRCSR